MPAISNAQNRFKGLAKTAKRGLGKKAQAPAGMPAALAPEIKAPMAPVAPKAPMAPKPPSPVAFENRFRAKKRTPKA
jgi:hypothetical protein